MELKKVSVKEKLVEDLKKAMKAREQLRLETIRMLITAIKNKEIEIGKELDDQLTGEVTAKAVKQRHEAAIQYRNAERHDLADKEEAEAVLLSEYMPEQLNSDVLRDFARQAIEESRAESIKDIGKVMKVLMPKVKGRADGGTVKKIVKELLS